MLRPARRRNVPVLECEEACRAATIRRVDAFLEEARSESGGEVVLPLSVNNARHEWYFVLDSGRSGLVVVGGDAALVEVFEGALSWAELLAQGAVVLRRYQVREDAIGTLSGVLLDDWTSVNHTFVATREGRGVIHQCSTVHRWRTRNSGTRALVLAVSRRASCRPSSWYAPHVSRAVPESVEAIGVIFLLKKRLATLLDESCSVVAVRFVQIIGRYFLGYESRDLAAHREDLLASPLFADRGVDDLFFHRCDLEARRRGAIRVRTEAVRLVDAYGNPVEAAFVCETVVGAESAFTTTRREQGHDVHVFCLPARIDLDSAWDLLPLRDDPDRRAWLAQAATDPPRKRPLATDHPQPDPPRRPRLEPRRRP